MPPLPKNIVWLVSYPKSGNTWIRILLSNYLSDEDKAVDINSIQTSGIASSRAILEKYIPFLSSDLTFSEIDNLRPEVYKKLSEESDGIKFIKTHDAFTKNKNQQDIFPISATRAIVHIVRNPLDVAVSFAHHSNIPVQKSIERLNNHSAKLANSFSRLNNQLRQKLLSWSEHYYSWKAVDTPYILVRYEDLIADTEAAFRKIIVFLYNDVDEVKLKQAVKYSSFELLKEQEENTSFKEKPIFAESFFRKGIAGSWKEEMTLEQSNTIISEHKKAMIELGYLKL